MAERSYRVKVGDTSYRWSRRHLKGTIETQAPNIGISDPVCDDEEESTIDSPVTNTTVMAEHTSEKLNVKESVQESLCKSHRVCRQPDQYGEWT